MGENAPRSIMSMNLSGGAPVITGQSLRELSAMLTEHAVFLSYKPFSTDPFSVEYPVSNLHPKVLEFLHETMMDVVTTLRRPLVNPKFTVSMFPVEASVVVLRFSVEPFEQVSAQEFVDFFARVNAEFKLAIRHAARAIDLLAD